MFLILVLRLMPPQPLSFAPFDQMYPSSCTRVDRAFAPPHNVICAVVRLDLRDL